jgi:hypothetical protein
MQRFCPAIYARYHMLIASVHRFRRGQFKLKFAPVTRSTKSAMQLKNLKLISCSPPLMAAPD